MTMTKEEILKKVEEQAPNVALLARMLLGYSASDLKGEGEAISNLNKAIEIVKLIHKESTETPAPIPSQKKTKAEKTVDVITRKENGEEKRQYADKASPVKENGEKPSSVIIDGIEYGNPKRRFFPGMGNSPLNTYVYLVDGKKVSCTEFSRKILPLVEKELMESQLKAYRRQSKYPIPGQMLKAGTVKVWERSIAGTQFKVFIAPYKN